MRSHVVLAVPAVLLLLLNGLALTQQSALPQNYTASLLRYAKAAEIKAYIDEGEEPCENFYKFACGGWKRFHPANEAHKHTTHLDQLQELYVRKSAQMLAGSVAADNKVERLLRLFYHSCLDKEMIRTLGLEPILQVADFKGGWPRITSPSWYEHEYDWLNVIADIRRELGIDIFVGLEIIPDFEDKFIHRIKVGAPAFELNTREAYVSSRYEEARAEYRRRIANKLHNYFKDMPRVWADEVAAQVLHVETELARGLPDNPRFTIQQTSRPRTVADLKTAYGSYVDLSRYLNRILNMTIYMPVYETPEDYLASLVDVIRDTPKLTLANYTMWRVISTFDFDTDVHRNPNDDWCVEQILEYFPHQLETMFYHNYNNRIQLQNELNSLWATIKREFRDEMQNTQKHDWMSMDSRQKAVQKIEAMELEFMSHEKENLNEMTGLAFDAEHYYRNIINIMKWRTQHNLATLFQKPQQVVEDIKLPKYRLTTNKIQIPVAFLQARFFWDETYPEATKYSTMGVLLAQQMLKGFDIFGRRHDMHGYQRSLWDIGTEHTFDDYATCFAKQYASYKYQGKNVNESTVLSTSVTDNGGLGIAYRAYQKWWTNIADNQLEAAETLPLLSFTQKQLFYISFAQLWCADYHDSAGSYNELPEHVRVNAALANLHEFANEFECDRGDKLNPEQRCELY